MLCLPSPLLAEGGAGATAGFLFDLDAGLGGALLGLLVLVDVFVLLSFNAMKGMMD